MKLNNKLQEDLERIIKGAERRGLNAEVKVSVYDIQKQCGASVYGDDSGWAASIIKVPILVSVIEEILKGNVAGNEKLSVNHQFTLQEGDRVSQMEEGSKVKIYDLLEYMIVESDNEATNMLVNRIGIDVLNKSMWNLGMNKSMFGHLLCSGVPRYFSSFNKDGSNITSPDDMTRIFRHIYDDDFSLLKKNVRLFSDYFMKKTYGGIIYPRVGKSMKVKSKRGFISDVKMGYDAHEVGIIDDQVIVSLMANKIGKKRVKSLKNILSKTNYHAVYLEIMNSIYEHLF